MARNSRGEICFLVNQIISLPNLGPLLSSPKLNLRPQFFLSTKIALFIRPQPLSKAAAVGGSSLIASSREGFAQLASLSRSDIAKATSTILSPHPINSLLPQAATCRLRVTGILGKKEVCPEVSKIHFSRSLSPVSFGTLEETAANRCIFRFA